VFYFILWVLTTTALFVIFRLYRKFEVDTLQAISINYTVCVLTGSLIEGQVPIPPISPENIPWLSMCLVLGLIFIPTFYVTAITTQKVGVMAVSLASRMSFFVPMLFSLFVFKIAGQDFNYLSYLGVFIAIMAIILSIYKPNRTKKTSDKNQPSSQKTRQWSLILLPLAVFGISGGMDTILNYTNHYLLSPEHESIFSILLFAVAGITGMLLLLVKYIVWRQKVALKSIIAGIALGIPNYFSIYLILKVLNQFDNNGAIVFPLFNVSVIGMATLSSVFFFKEKLFWYNKLGLVLAIVAIFLIAHKAFI
jgi:drug/metabolite transporter (DMT)-like permease